MFDYSPRDAAEAGVDAAGQPVARFQARRRRGPLRLAGGREPAPTTPRGPVRGDPKPALRSIPARAPLDMPLQDLHAAPAQIRRPARGSLEILRNRLILVLGALAFAAVDAVLLTHVLGTDGRVTAWEALTVGLSALLFAGLQTGTASRNLDPTIFAPGVGSSLAVIIQGLVVLFVGADLLILILLGWLRRGRRRPTRSPA